MRGIDHIVGDQTRGVDTRDGIVADVAREIVVARLKAEWIFADEAAKLRVVEAGAVIELASVRIAFSAGVTVSRCLWLTPARLRREN